MTDPTAALVQMTEKAWTAWLDALDSGLDVVLKSPLFVWGVGRSLDLRHKVRAKRDEAAEKALSETRLASKGDLERMAADAHRLEAKVNEVLLVLEEQSRVPRAVPAVDEALAALQARVAELTARLATVEAGRAPEPPAAVGAVPVAEAPTVVQAAAEAVAQAEPVTLASAKAPRRPRRKGA